MSRNLVSKSTFLAMVVALSLQGEAAQSADLCYAIGDVDCSGTVTIGDIFQIIEFFDGSHIPPPCPYQMDVNGDCVIDRTDYIALLDCMFSTDLHCFPIETCCAPELAFSCCPGGLGDANGGGDEPTIGDISVIIDAVFIRGNCDLICIPAADINGSGGANPTCADITIGDISTLIDCLFILGNIQPCYQPCQ